MKIHSKALLISIAPAAVIVAILLMLLLSSYRTSLTEHAVNEIKVELESLANFIDGRNLQAVSTAKTLAATQQAGLLGKHKESLAVAKQALQNHSQFQGAYFGYEPHIAPVPADAVDLDSNCCTNGRFLPYFFRGTSGIELAPLADMETGLYYNGLKELWQKSRASDEHWLITEPYVYEGVPLVEQVYPLIIDGKFAGIAGVDRKLDQLFTLIENFQPHETSKTYLISRLGKFITTTHRADELSMNPVSQFPTLNRLFKEPDAGERSHISEGIDPETGEAIYVVYTNIPTGEWSLVTTVERSEVLAPVTASTLQALLTAVVLILLLSALVYVLVAKMVSQPLTNIVEKLEEIAQGGGNLKTRVDIDSNDEIGALARAFNQFIGTQATMIGQISNATGEMDRHSVTMKQHLGSTLEAVSSQQSEHLQVSTAVSEMSATAKEVAQNVTLVANNISDVSKDVEHGQRSVGDTVNGVSNLQMELSGLSNTIDDVSKSANEIGSVLEVINGIAEQTNLLALNAAIEAARAGEQGRGFAVVADEVRTLAQRTQSSTLEIQQVIETLQRTADQAVSSMVNNRENLDALVSTANVAGESLSKITAAMGSIEDISTQISVAAEEQSSTTDEIDRNIIHIVESSERCGQLAQQTSDSLQSLEQSAQEVARMVNSFEH